MKDCCAILGLCLLQMITFGLSSDLPPICPDIVSRSRWKGRAALAVEYSIIPVKNVIIHHTVSGPCETEGSCEQLLRSTQAFHMDTLDFHDLGYNFVIGGDGRVYEGAGWHKTGAHTRGYNSRSLGIAFIGDYTENIPSKEMLRGLKSLLECGVELGELDSNYKLFGARQVSATLSPGTRLYREIKTWPHYTSSP